MCAHVVSPADGAVREDSQPTMHNCPPPKTALDAWLRAYSDVSDGFGHLLLEQETETDETLVDALRPYFESAHLDARQYFHEILRIDLHPDADGPGAHAAYPNALRASDKRGLFGEVVAGLVTEAYAFVGDYKWTIPVFLFRYHADVEHYLFALSRDESRGRQVFGRQGSDFVALCLNADGSVKRFLAGEAKWRSSFTQNVVDALLLGKKVDDPNRSGAKIHSGKGIWFELNRDTKTPHGISQIHRLLCELDPEEYGATIISLDRALALNNVEEIPRTDLVVLAGNASSGRESGEYFVDWPNKPAEYEAGNDLQVVELVLNEGDELVDEIYNTLWSANANE